MNTNWIPLQSIPPTGKTLALDDPAVWRVPMEEFALPCRVVNPLRTEIFILPREHGVLFQGRITGSVALPCDRCADDSLVELDHAFDNFEPYPAEMFLTPYQEPGRKPSPRAERAKNTEEEGAAPGDADEAVIRNAAHGRGVEINPAALAWQEFSLALPVRPLCGENCKGLCPGCGSNLNHEICTCPDNSGDPRLAALRNLTVKKIRKH